MTQSVVFERCVRARQHACVCVRKSVVSFDKYLNRPLNIAMIRHFVVKGAALYSSVSQVSFINLFCRSLLQVYKSLLTLSHLTCALHSALLTHFVLEGVSFFICLT